MTAPPPPGSSSRARWQHVIREAFAERLGIKALSIVIAILLWLIVKGRQPVQDYVMVRVMPTLDSSLVLLEQPTTLTALVSGRAVDIAKLRADPPAVHRIVEEDVPDTLLFPVGPSDVRVSAELADFIHVLDVQPRLVSLRFGNKATRQVPVVTGPGLIHLRRGTALLPDDHVGIKTEPRTVRVTGPRQLVRRIKSVHTYSMTITEGDTTAQLADIDTTGLGVRIAPSRVRVYAKCSVMEGKSGPGCPP
jgi:YbbR domain-containing protein